MLRMASQVLLLARAVAQDGELADVVRAAAGELVPYAA